MLAYLYNPAVIGLTALFLAVVWMLRDEKDKTRPLLVMALVLNLGYGWVLGFVMGRENGLVPWKWDYVLLRLDEALGLRAAPIAGWLQFARIPLFVVYQLLVPMMIAWFLVSRKARQPGAIILAYITEMLTGPLLYAVVPACGPRYAFHARWLNPPAVDAVPIRLSGMPNAFPSLHVATALVFVLFAPTRLTRGIALVFLAGTALATLSTGEHYVIDLVAGLAFGSFAWSVGRRKLGTAFASGGLALGWSLAVRLGTGLLLGHPGFLKACACAAVLATGSVVLWKWMDTEPAPQIAERLLEDGHHAPASVDRSPSSGRRDGAGVVVQ